MPPHRFHDDPSVSEQIVQTWKNLPELSRRLAVGIVTLSFIVLLMPAFKEVLVLCPRNTIGLQLWNVLTFVAVETNLISAVIHAGVLAMMGRLVEPVWGPRELAKFLGLITAFSGLCTFFAATLICMVATSSWLTDYYCGALPLIAGLSVALKQLVPDQEVRVFVVRLRVKHFPFLLVAVLVTWELLVGSGARRVSTTLDPAGQEILRRLPMRSGPGLPVMFAVYGAWLYLRYFQSYLNAADDGDGGSGGRGDPSESFAFHTFFPETLQPAVRPLGSIVHRRFHPLIVRMRGARPTPAPAPAGRTVGGPQLGVLPLPMDPEEIRRKTAAAATQRAAAGGGSASDPVDQDGV